MKKKYTKKEKLNYYIDRSSNLKLPKRKIAHARIKINKLTLQTDSYVTLTEKMNFLTKAFYSSANHGNNTVESTKKAKHQYSRILKEFATRGPSGLEYRKYESFIR